MKRSILLMTAASVIARDLAAQACALGPGEAFGVIAYQCANCGFKRDAGRSIFQFFAEPVVTEAKPGSMFRVGDVIEAVDGKPITTSAGAEVFTYPPPGDREISIRRGRVRHGLRFTISGTGCSAVSQLTSRFMLAVDDIESIDVVKGPTAVAEYGPAAAGNGVIVIKTKQPSSTAQAHTDSLRARVREILGPPGNFVGRPQPMIVVDGIPVSPDEARALGIPFDRTGRFGFAVGCQRACTPLTGKDGPLFYTYYKYSEFPSIIGVRPGGAADRAGIRAGDVVTKVDGVSVSEDEGAKNLARLERREHARVTVRRDGKEIEFSLQADR